MESRLGRKARIEIVQQIVPQRVVRQKIIHIVGKHKFLLRTPYRREGHASAIMRAVADIIHDSDGELAILFCDEELAPFYGARGWQVAPAGSIQAPGTAPRTMACAGPALGTRLDTWLAAAPLVLDARW